MEDKAESIPERCASCGAKLKGDYCRKCGEKKIVPERDFSIPKFLNQTLWHFIHFDSKSLRSFWQLFSKPGFLTAEWIAGRRVGYLKPVQMFVVAALLFYFFLPTVTAYFSSPRDLIAGYENGNILLNTFHYDCGKALTERAIELQLEEDRLGSNITTAAAQKSKTWLFLVIPFWGVLIYSFFRRKIPWLVPHFIFVMHGLAFYILSDLGIHAILQILGFSKVGKYILILLMLTFSLYLAIAVRRVYGSSWSETILKTIGITTGFIVLLLLYRQVITIWTIAAL